MKKILVFIVTTFMLLTISLASCKDKKEELQSHAAQEMSEIADILGNVANDYLSTKITKDEAEEKLDVLYARISALEDEVSVDNVVTDDEAMRTSLQGDIVSFRYDMWKGTTDKISEIKEEYYKE